MEKPSKGMEKPTHIPNVSEEIRLRYERKLAELQATRTTKNPERAEKLRRKRANRKAQRQAARLSQHQKDTKSNTNNKALNTQHDEKTEKEGALIVSKMDGSRRKEQGPLPKNPSQALQKLQNHKEKLQQLAPKERDSKKKEEAWAKAIQKTKGIVVKDDEKRLQASLKSREKEKERSAKKWDDKNETLNASMGMKQKKRQANIKQRIDAKKARKMKRRR